MSSNATQYESQKILLGRVATLQQAVEMLTKDLGRALERAEKVEREFDDAVRDSYDEGYQHGAYDAVDHK